MKKKELRKLLSHFLKLNAAGGSGQGQDGKQPQQQMTALQVGWWTLIRTQEPSPMKSKCDPCTNINKNLLFQAKLHYLKIISDLPSYGAKCFSTNISVSLNYININQTL